MLGKLKAFFGALLIVALVPAHAQGAYDLDIPAQSLAKALRAVGQRTATNILFEPALVKGLQAPAIRAQLTLDEAVRQLLSGTELVAQRTSRDTIVVRNAKTEDPARAEVPVSQSGNGFQLAQVVGPQSTVPAQKMPVDGEVVSADEAGQTGPVEILVTGSRIAASEPLTAHPVTILTRKDIERAGISTLGDLVRLIPQLGPHSKTAGTGVSGRNLDNPNTIHGPDNARTTANLRGLSNNTTLVLVDGRRLSRTGQGSGADNYDLGGIPLSAVERIEVLSAGASAVYGADAIAGAINIILKKKFAGIDAGTAYDGTFDGGAAVRSISLSPGFTLGRLNGFASFSYLEQNQLRATDRWFTASDDKTSLGGTSNLGLPGTSGSGRVNSAFPFGPLPGLVPPDTQVAIPQGSDGVNVGLADYQNAGPIAPGIDNARYVNLIDPRREISVLLRMGYDLTARTELFVDGRWSQRLHEVHLPPIVMQLNGLPADIAGTEYDQFLPADYPGNPFGVPITVTRTLFDAPAEFTESSSHLKDWGATAGARGELPRGWKYETSLSWARSRLDANRYGFDANHPGFLALIHDPDPSRRPNLLDDSTTGPPTLTFEQLLAGAITFPSAELSDTSVYGLHTRGPLFTLPTGTVNAAVGAEYTDEKARFITVPGDTSFNSQVSDAGRSVRSMVAELSVPLAPEGRRPLLRRLVAGVQARYDDYAFFESEVSPGFSLLYSPADGVVLRASTSKGFKVPGLRDLYGPDSTAAAFIPPGGNAVIDPVTNQPITGIVRIFREPNPDLNPETSTSVNFGLVLDPGRAGLAALEGLTVSVDRFDIDYTNMVANPGLQDVVTFFPELLQRAAPDGPVTGFISRPTNFASLRARGWDYRVTYERIATWGALTFQAAYSRPDSTETRLSPLAAPTVRDAPDRGQASLFWTRGNLEAGINAHYQSTYLVGSGVTQRELASELGYDPQIAYRFGRSGNGLLANSRISLTIFNAFYKKVTVGDAVNNAWVIDPRLRRYALTLNKSF